MILKTISGKIQNWRWLLTSLKIAFLTVMLSGMPDLVIESFQNTETTPLLLVLFGGLIGLLFIVTLIRYYSDMHRITWREMGIADVPLLKIALIGASVAVFNTAISWLLQNLTLMPVVWESPVGRVFRQYLAGSFSDRFFIVYYIFMLAAGEEILFRGLLLAYLKKYTSRWLAIILSSALFTLVHIHPQNFPILFMQGLVLGVSFELSGAIWAPIIAHGLYNLGVALLR